MSYERDDCPHCNDFGPCMYCARGREAGQKELKKMRQTNTRRRPAKKIAQC